MIHSVIEYLVNELNDYVKLRSGSDEMRVIAGSLFSLDGTPDQQAKNKVVLNLVNLEEDRVAHSVDTFVRRNDDGADVVKPDIHVNLYLLFVCNFTQYNEALKAILLVIAFFQHHAAVDYALIGLEGRKGRITFKLFSPTFEQQNHLWGALGAKYMPSVLFKAGLVDISDEVVEGEAAPVQEVAVND